MKFHTHTLRSLALLTGVSSLTRAFSVGRPSSAAFLRTANPHFAVADPNLSPFRTWTFDTPCASMAWNSLPSATISTTLTLNETSDLILLGVHNKTLTGLAKSIDEQLQGAFTEMVQKKNIQGKSRQHNTHDTSLCKWKGTSFQAIHIHTQVVLSITTIPYRQCP